ncbi:uncharacterized protein WCC33_014236 [Rhinophrynus dorsalis]
MSEDVSDDIIEFLRDRGLPEDLLDVLKEEKIDRNVVMLLDDDSLSSYIPSYGDRIALFNFCKRSEPVAKRKMGLFEKLRNKLKLRKAQEQTTMNAGIQQNSTRGRKTHRKITRSIEIGWLHEDEGVIKQVRTKQGGGTRKVAMPKTAGKEELMQQGKSLFFPAGKSSKGHESVFEFDMCDFQQNSLNTDVTIGSMYEAVKLPMLRFYLITVPKKRQDKGNTDASINDDIPPPEVFVIESEDEYSMQNKNNESIAEEQIPDNVSCEFVEQTIFESELSGTIDDDIEITFGPEFGSNEDLNETILWLEPTPPPSVVPKDISTIKIHYVDCMNDMINAFSDPEILSKTLNIRRLLPDNTEEAGTGSGVLRDVICQFWQEFYERCTLGATLKVPFIRHDFTAETWKAIARIVAKGYQDCGYMPTKLALPFMEEVLYDAVYSDLKSYFLQYISYSERETLKEASEHFSAVDTEDILDVLDNYECRRNVSAETLTTTILEIAHKELVQRPMFVIDCWRDILQPLLTLSPEELSKLYIDLQPTGQKVLKLLNYPEDMTPKQKEVANHLRRYIRELDYCQLQKFLRYCTGSDLIVTDRITLYFENMTHFSRRPIGRTCSMILQISDDYDNFPDFRAEFNAVLDTNIWVMEIV